MTAGISDFAGTTIETVGGNIDVPAGLPDWVTLDDMVAAAGGLAPSAPQADTSGSFDGQAVLNDTPPADTSSPYNLVAVQGPGGVAYIAPGAPDWVNAAALASVGLDSPTPPASQIQVPPATTLAQIPPSLPPPAPSTAPSGLLGAAKAAADAALNKARQVGDAIGQAASEVGAVKDGILGAVEGAINALLPTVSELALGLTSRFADLGASIAGKVVEVGEFAQTMAVHAGAAMSAVLEDAWAWFADALLWLVRSLAGPLVPWIEGIKANQQVGGI